ncbi:MAG: 2'-5' RNA ligase family protein [Candidatus Pristimantibacillus sp.]
MQFGIVVYPSNEVQEYANHYRIRHDPHYSIIPPHMTVRENEELTQDQQSAAITHLESVTAAIAPFNVSYNRVSNFFPVNNVIYLALEDPTPMIVLHEAVSSGPLTIPAPNYVYTPHTTIGQQMLADELHDIYANLRMSTIQLSTRVDKVLLLNKTENGTWNEFQTFHLRG